MNLIQNRYYLASLYFSGIFFALSVSLSLGVKQAWLELRMAQVPPWFILRLSYRLGMACSWGFPHESYRAGVSRYVCEYVLRGIHIWPPPPPIRLTPDASWYAYALLASSGVPRRDLLRPALALETVTFQKDFK